MNSSNLRQVEAECSFGAMKLYLDNVSVPSGEAVVSLDVSFGGIELYIPKNWTVEKRIDTAFSGMEENEGSSPDGTVTLILDGSVHFGGISIHYI